jgi:toxin CptA
MKSVPAIAFDYAPSRWLLAALIGVATVAVLAIAASGIRLWLQLLLAAAACLYAWHSCRSLLRPAIRRCAWYESGHWRVRDMAGQDHAVSLRQASVRGSLIVLRFHSPLRRGTTLVLLPDNCDADTRRRLRVRLARADSVEANA